MLKLNHRSSWLVLILLLVIIAVSRNSMAVTDRDLQANPQTLGLTIIYPKGEFFPQNNWNNSLQFMVFDNEDASQTNLSDCYISIYNLTGQPIVYNTPLVVVGNDYTYNLPISISAVPGIYTYTAWCETDQDILFGYASATFQIQQGGKTQTELPISMSLVLVTFFAFVCFLATYFTLQKHPLSYLFMMLAFIVADVLIWLNWRILHFNNSPIANVFYIIFLAMISITFVMFIVTAIDVTRLAIKMNTDKKAKENIARYGYA